MLFLRSAIPVCCYSYMMLFLCDSTPMLCVLHDAGSCHVIGAYQTPSCSTTTTEGCRTLARPHGHFRVPVCGALVCVRLIGVMNFAYM